MIIIIRALPKKKKKERPKKKKKKEKRKKIKKIKKIKGEMVLYLFPHLCFKVAPCSSCSEYHILCFKVAPCFSYSESHMLSLSYTSGNFSLQNLGCIFLRWASSNALGIREQASWMHTHQFSFVEHSFIALVHPLHGNPYSSC